MNKPVLITLSDGHLMPQLGLGVWKTGNDEVGVAVSTALETGYRLIDTAAVYQNEEGVGDALKSATVPRDELFITTKLWNSDQQNAGKALEESLKNNGIDLLTGFIC